MATIKYACFDESNDNFISIGVFDTEEDADIAAYEHGLPEDGTEWYVAAAKPVMIEDGPVRGQTQSYLTYEPYEPCGYCGDSQDPNDICETCYVDMAEAHKDSPHDERCHEFWDRGLNCPHPTEQAKDQARAAIQHGDDIDPGWGQFD